MIQHNPTYYDIITYNIMLSYIIYKDVIHYAHTLYCII